MASPEAITPSHPSMARFARVGRRFRDRPPCGGFSEIARIRLDSRGTVSNFRSTNGARPTPPRCIRRGHRVAQRDKRDAVLVTDVDTARIVLLMSPGS
jgi:hypothetical protein